MNITLSINKQTGFLMHDQTPEERLERYQNTPDDEFVRLLVHDLRGPLSGVISAAKLINVLVGSDHPNAAQLRELGQILLRTGDNLRGILDTAIEHDRIQRGEPADNEDGS
ncbi:MAG: hypothetical protein CL610_19455 [Anaerolineaceae bacterium]|nr:hypothetical protein [Anaerolineaceae bacterium]